MISELILMHGGLFPTGFRVKFYLDSLRFLIILAYNSKLLKYGRSVKLDHSEGYIIRK